MYFILLAKHRTIRSALYISYIFIAHLHLHRTTHSSSSPSSSYIIFIVLQGTISMVHHLHRTIHYFMVFSFILHHIISFISFIFIILFHRILHLHCNCSSYSPSSFYHILHLHRTVHYLLVHLHLSRSPE